jgi:hypothetical protein
MKSNINSEQVKKLVADAVEKALNQCAYQHDCNLEMGSSSHKITNSQPVKLKLTFDFFWTSDERKIPDMFCQPTIDLTVVI